MRGAAGGAAARGGGGDGGRRGRRQARCRRSGDGRYSDRAGRRQTAPHADAAPRRNPRSRKCAGAKRRVAASEAKRPKGPQGTACADPTATPWLSADRMCWAGDAAAFSRTRLGRRDAWRWTRPRSAIWRLPRNAPKKAKLSEGRFGEAEPEGCASIRGRGRSQAPSATGGRGCITAAQAGLANRASQAERKRVPSGIPRTLTGKHANKHTTPHNIHVFTSATLCGAVQNVSVAT